MLPVPYPSGSHQSSERNGELGMHQWERFLVIAYLKSSFVTLAGA